MCREKVWTEKCPRCDCHLSEAHLDSLENAHRNCELLGGFVTAVSKRDYLCPECFDLHLGEVFETNMV